MKIVAVMIKLIQVSHIHQGAKYRLYRLKKEKVKTKRHNLVCRSEEKGIKMSKRLQVTRFRFSL